IFLIGLGLNIHARLKLSALSIDRIIRKIAQIFIDNINKNIRNYNPTRDNSGVTQSLVMNIKAVSQDFCRLVFVYILVLKKSKVGIYYPLRDVDNVKEIFEFLASQQALIGRFLMVKNLF
ncbi:4970_t:CDS:1, partial [Funneliformis caledonium]